MTSVLIVFQVAGAGVLEEFDEVHFVQPVKGVFGRMACDTDGSVGDTMVLDPPQLLAIIDKCDQIDGDRLSDAARAGLAKVRGWAESGQPVFIEWRH